jgi:hypothetical protein
MQNNTAHFISINYLIDDKTKQGRGLDGDQPNHKYDDNE